MSLGCGTRATSDALANTGMVQGFRVFSITHLCAPAEVGGLERVVQGLASEGVARGHQVRVVTVQHPRADLNSFIAELEGCGVETVLVKVSGRQYLKEFQAISRLLAQDPPDVLHTHGYRCDILHGWHARRRGIATVSTLHGSSRMGGLSHFFEWVQLRALRRFDGVVAVSKPLAEELRTLGIPTDRLHMVPNAWAPPESPLSRSESRDQLGLQGVPDPIIGWVGRLIRIKGCDRFLEALVQIKKLRWNAIIIGHGPERSALEAWVQEQGLSERVRFLGSVPNAARFFSAFDLQVLSSRSEGTPMVVLEAMGAGVPMVATAVGGVPYLLEDGEDGWVVSPESPGALADALRLALTDAGDRERRAQNARRKVASEYSAERWMERHEEVYTQSITRLAGATGRRTARQGTHARRT